MLRIPLPEYVDGPHALPVCFPQAPQILQRSLIADEDMRPSAPALGNGSSCPAMTTLRFALPRECFSRISLRSTFFLKQLG